MLSEASPSTLLHSIVSTITSLASSADQAGDRKLADLLTCFALLLAEAKVTDSTGHKTYESPGLSLDVTAYP